MIARFNFLKYDFESCMENSMCIWPSLYNPALPLCHGNKIAAKFPAYSQC